MTDLGLSETKGKKMNRRSFLKFLAAAPAAPVVLKLLGDQQPPGQNVLPDTDKMYPMGNTGNITLRTGSDYGTRGRVLMTDGTGNLTWNEMLKEPLPSLADFYKEKGVKS
jgi:uncharacterized protein with NRDE domain